MQSETGWVSFEMGGEAPFAVQLNSEQGCAVFRAKFTIKEVKTVLFHSSHAIEQIAALVDEELSYVM